MQIVIEKMERPEQCGDWHDKPVRYKVIGPGTELQKFSTIKQAKAYRADRRRSKDQHEAGKLWDKRPF